MPAQRTLLDGDTGQKFDSLELLAGAAAAGGVEPPAVASSVTDDFLAGTTSSLLGWMEDDAGMGAGVQLVDQGLDARHQGLARAQTGSSATGRAALRLANTQSNVGAGGSTLDLALLVRLEDLSDVAEEYVVHIGLSDVVANGILWIYDRRDVGPTWQAAGIVGGVPVLVDTGVPVVAGAWIHLRMLLTPAEGARFYLDGALVATIAQGSLPDETVSMGASFSIEKRIGMMQRRLTCDYVQIAYTFDPPR